MSLAIGRYRAQDDGLSLFKIVTQHVKWLLFMILFFGGLSWHVMTALLAVRPVSYSFRFANAPLTRRLSSRSTSSRTT